MKAAKLSSPQQEKRKFLSHFTSLLPWALAGSVLYPTGRFLFFQADSRGTVTLPLKQLQEGITPLLTQNLYLYKQNDIIKVYDAHCTHMGCILHFDDINSVFNCPCHKSRFDITGIKLRGPAKRNLDTITYKIKNKTLYIG